MASTSFRNVVSVLALAEGVATQIEKEYRQRQQNKTVLGLTAKVKASCRYAHDLWNGDLDEKDLIRIRTRMTEVESRSFMNGLAEPATYCGFALGCLSDLYEHVRDLHRIAALDDINRRLMSLNRYFDTKLKRHECYVAAGRAVELWRKTGE